MPNDALALDPSPAMDGERAGITRATPSTQPLLSRIAELEAEVESLRQAQGDSDRELLNQFAATTTGWFWEMDADLRFTYFSPNVASITGVEAQWHYGKTREELGIACGVSTEQWRAHLEILERHEPFRNFVFERQGPDGRRWMCTSGQPVFDENGNFCGYRGSANDVTAEVTARHAAEQLLAVIENIDELFVLWDADDRLVMCNARFREINAAVAHTLTPGTAFEDHLRAALDAGMYPQAVGRESQWLQERLDIHRQPSCAVELERQDGRWLLIHEHRMADGSTATISTDITARKAQERHLEQHHQLLATALQTIPDGVQVLDSNLTLVAHNERLWQVMELDGEAILNAANPGKAFRYALASRGEYGDGDIHALVASREAIARSPSPVHYERQLVSGKWIECRGSPIPGGGYLAIYRDIDERKRMLTELERLATRDDLTGLSNRRSFLEYLEKELQRARRYGREVSLAVIDVDHFKSVNDRFGHTTGDHVLRCVSHTLNSVLREADTVGRLGGEEFAAVLPESDLARAQVAGERLREAVAALRLEASGKEFEVTISVGIAQASSDCTVKDLITHADDALYRAKANGRNQVVVDALP